jgi:hypothetical protein
MTTEGYLAEIDSIKRNLQDNDCLEDILYFKKRNLYLFEKINSGQMKFFIPSDRLEENLMEAHTEGAVLQLLETSDSVFISSFLQKYREKFSENDFVTAYKSILKNPNFTRIPGILLHDAKQLSKESLAQLKDDVLNVALSGKSNLTLAFYAYSYGVNDIKKEDIHNLMTENLSTYTLLLQYPKSLDAKTIHSVFDEITKGDAIPAKKGISKHLQNWYYTPGITQNHVDILNSISSHIYDGDRFKKDQAKLMELFELINQRDLHDLKFSNYVHPQRSLFTITKKLKGNDVNLHY